MTRDGNIDQATVKGFGEQWSRFDQRVVETSELEAIFSIYFRDFPWQDLPDDPSGFDLGCGTGRWAKLVAPRVERLFCFDASEEAAVVAKRNLASAANAHVAAASVESIPLEDESMDFGYSLGVLHHIPDTLAGLRACHRKLKTGAPFMVYLYYAFDNRPWWFGALWKCANVLRKVVSRLPGRARYLVSQLIAFGIYWPVARGAALIERLGMDVEWIPMSGYRHRSLYTLRTDALDRFGTSLVQRFTAEDVRALMAEAGFEDVHLSDGPPYWTAVGYKANRST